MEYRKLPHGGEQISIIGLGNSSIGVLSEGEIEDTISMALENGINGRRRREAFPSLWAGSFRMPEQGIFSNSLWRGLSQWKIWQNFGFGRD